MKDLTRDREYCWLPNNYSKFALYFATAQPGEIGAPSIHIYVRTSNDPTDGITITPNCVCVEGDLSVQIDVLKNELDRILKEAMKRFQKERRP